MTKALENEYAPCKQSAAARSGCSLLRQLVSQSQGQIMFANLIQWLYNLRPNSLKRPFFKFLLIRACRCQARLCQRAYYAIHITASQFLGKLRDASASVTRNCNFEFAAISCCIVVFQKGAFCRQVAIGH